MPLDSVQGGHSVIGRRNPLSAWLAAAAVVSALCACAFGVDRSSDQRFLAGLRQRRLFELAEHYCTGRLKEPELPDRRRVELTIERSLTLADWAVNSPPDRREPL